MILFTVTISALFAIFIIRYYNSQAVHIDQGMDWHSVAIKTPNYYLLCPPDTCQQEHQESPRLAYPRKDVLKAWQQVVSQQSRVELVNIDQNLHLYQYIQRSLVFRFPDVITIQFFVISPQETTFALLSRSIVGHSDFGVNRQRVTTWVKLLVETLENEINHEKAN